MTVKMSSDNLDHDHCPKCGIAMTDCTDYRAEIERSWKALKAVEEWWLEEGMKHFTGAPYAILAVREVLFQQQAKP